MKIIIIQCNIGLSPENLKKLWQGLYKMDKAGILVLPEYCKLIGVVEVDKNDN